MIELTDKKKEKIMKIISKDGVVMPVDDSKVDYDKNHIPYVSTVTLVDENVYLKPMWIATVQHDKNAMQSFRPTELEFVAEKVFDHDPTEQELIYFMSENGCGIADYVSVAKAFKLDCHYD